MSMKLGINGGSMEITDNNETIVSLDIAKEIQDNCQNPDDKQDWKAPELKNLYVCYNINTNKQRGDKE